MAEKHDVRTPVTALLLDNLWLWMAILLGIALIYGAWALIETTTMHTPPGIKPRGWG